MTGIWKVWSYCTVVGPLLIQARRAKDPTAMRIITGVLRLRSILDQMNNMAQSIEGPRHPLITVIFVRKRESIIEIWFC